MNAGSRAPDSLALELWDALRSSAAVAAGPPIERTIAIAGRTIRLRLFGGVAEVIRAPFAHLEAPDHAGHVSATVTLWDSASCGAPPVPLPAPIPNDREGTSYAWSDGQRRLRWWPRTSVLMAHDPRTREAWWWVPDAADTPWHERVAPLRPVLFWWSEEEGLHLLHAGAVGTRGGHGVLLGGPGGAGKSTTAVACLLSGLAYLGDDYVVWEPSRGPVVHGLYATAKLEPDALRRLADLRLIDTGTATSEKVVVDISQAFPGLITTTSEVRAVLLPTLSPRGPQLAETTRSEALRAMAPSTVLQRRGGSGTIVADLAQLLARVPCFRLHLGPDPLAVPAVIEQFLGEL